MAREDKVPPQDLDAEQSVLGAMMISKEAIDDSITKLKPEFFYRPAHGLIYSAILSLFEKSEPIDLVTISAELKKQGHLDQAGGKSYLADVLDTVPTASNVEYYANIVQEKALLRRLIDAGSEIVTTAFSDIKEVPEIIEDAQQLITDISREGTRDEFVHLKDIITPVLDGIESAYEDDDRILGVSTGYNDLDNLTSGFQRSDLIILAARPAMGKTTLAMNFALHAALQKQTPVAFFSCEMPKEQLALRLLSMESKISLSRLRTAKIQDHEYKSLSHAMGRLSETPIYIDDSPSLTPMALRAKCRRLQKEADVGLVVVDYLQLLRSGKKRIDSRFQEVSDIVRDIKAYARELNVPVIALSQLSRDIEKRGDTMPKLSDLRESGEIEQTADLVMFIHRDYYDSAQEKVSPSKVIIAKQRNGPTGEVDLVFRKDVLKFEMSTSAGVGMPTPPPAHVGM